MTIPEIITQVEAKTAKTTRDLISDLVNGAGPAYDTLLEIQNIIGTDTNTTGTILNTLSKKADKATTLSGYGITDATPSSHIGSNGTSHSVATQTLSGFMSSTDKAKLDNMGGIATYLDNATYFSTTYTMTKNTVYLLKETICNNKSANLPTTGLATGNTIQIFCDGSTADGSNFLFTLNGNGITIEGNSSLEIDVTEVTINLMYISGFGWKVYSIFNASVDFDTMIINKADKATTLSGYGITDAYTKTQIDTITKWLGSNKTVSASEPLSTDGVNGDIWFVYES